MSQADYTFSNRNILFLKTKFLRNKQKLNVGALLPTVNLVLVMSPKLLTLLQNFSNEMRTK